MAESAASCDSPGAECLVVLVFTVADRAYALPLSTVHRVVRAVEITALPDAPSAVLGVINVRGRIVPVFDLRKRFRLPSRELSTFDHIVIAATSQRTVAVVADAVRGVFEYSPAQVVDKPDLPLDLRYVRGIVRLENGMILIHDLDTFLSPDEAAILVRSLERGAHGA